MENSPVVLTLTLNNSQPIPLSSFVKAFTSLAEEYSKAVREDAEFEDSDAEIYVKEVRSGSIIADLVPIATSIAPLIASEADKVYLAIEFVKKWEERLTDFANGVLPEKTSRKELKTVVDAVEAIARDPNASSKLEAATFEDGERNVRASFTFRTEEAKQITDVIEGEFKRLDEKQHSDHERVLMVFTRSDVGDAPVGKRSGEKVVVSELSDKPLALTYGSELAEEQIKHEIRETDENVYKKGFIVDLKVQSVGERPVAYSIVHVHQIIELPD